MIATIIRVILGGLWKPIAAILGALGLYAKARADQRRADEIKRGEAYRKTNEVVTNETLSDDPIPDIRKRLRDRARRD